MASKLTPSPRPNSWYFVGQSSDVPRGAVLRRRILDREAVIFRTQSGRLAAVDAYCPHMGAHFAHGGTVEGETLRCPFHAFRFDCEGRCVATGYGAEAPRKAHVRVWPLRKIDDFLFVYYDRDENPPSWELPEIDTEGWTPPKSYAWDLSCHPQDIAENAIDLGHLKVVHGYDPLEVLKPFSADGPRFQVAYRLHRSAGLFLKSGKMTVELTIHAFGLGYACAEINIPAYGIRFRNYTLVTPTDLGRTTLRVAVSLKRVSKAGKINPLLWLIPPAVLNRTIARILLLGVILDVGHDVEILKHRSYIHPPVLAKGDGPVVPFRLWADQFTATSEV